MTAKIRIERATLAMVQDLGRPGLGALGIPASGASDQHAARTANALVGNADTAPLIEVIGSELVVRPDRDLLLAVTGAADVLRVDGHPFPAWELVPVHAESEIRVPTPSVGLRSYLAFNGTLLVSRALGSVAPDPLLGLGTRLEPGVVLELETRLDGHPAGHQPLFRLGAHRPSYVVEGVSTIAITEGPDLDRVVGGASRLTDTFTVGQRSDAVGLRLDGQPLALARYDEILSRGVPVGAVEIPPAGSIIVLLRARLVTAGYPVIAVATTTALDTLAQLRPGAALRFQPSSITRAVTELRAQRDAHHALATRVRTALSARGLAYLVDDDHATATTAQEPR
ncbi:MAG: biotin-dependent carboxyltransferase family protein [Actinomycetota bacterium]|nr:biotin-dependent carboxyltransferase family protein [Actinomycetota bacterium]